MFLFQVLSLVPYITLTYNLLAPGDPDQLLQLATQKIAREPTVKVVIVFCICNVIVVIATENIAGEPTVV